MRSDALWQALQRRCRWPAQKVLEAAQALLGAAGELPSARD